MKSTVLCVSTLALLTACATGPKPVQVLAVCPRVPPLELDVPERDYLQEMQHFLQGLLPTQPGLKQPSPSVWPTGQRLNAN